MEKRLNYISENILANNRLDFDKSKLSLLYQDYTPEKYFTYERWWNQSGYCEKIYDTFCNFDDSFLRDAVITDLGSGKGQALISLALDFNLGEINGVELHEDYINKCRENIQTIIDSTIEKDKKQKLSQINLIQSDLNSYEFSGQENILFMFNPVGPETMKNVRLNLLKSLAEFPRPLYIVYRNHIHRNIFTEDGLFGVWFEHPDKKQKISILEFTNSGDVV